MRTVLSVLLSCLVALGALAPPATAEEAVVPNDQYVVGGCQVRFDASGAPYLAPARYTPCIGASTVSINASGDLVVGLSQSSALPVIRLFVMPDEALTGRGVTAGLSGGRSSLAVRLYDDRLGRRLNLANSADRARVGGGSASLTVGWTKAAGRDGAPSAAQIDPGYNAYGAYHDRATTDAHTVQGGCVVRFDATRGTPWVHANATHHCTGVASVGISSAGDLQVRLSEEQNGSALVNVQSDPDETLTARGILVGMSGGASIMNYRFYDSRLNRRLDLRSGPDRLRLAGSTSNLWLTWTKTADRPGSPNASTAVMPNKYGSYMHGSSAPGTIAQTGCLVRFSQVDGRPEFYASNSSLCTGVEAVGVTTNGKLRVWTSDAATAPVVSTTTVSSRAVTDYGVRAGLSGGGSMSTYTLYSHRLGRVLNLNLAADRKVLQRSGSGLLLGWSRPRV